jgi:hypothetical protein
MIETMYKSSEILLKYDDFIKKNEDREIGVFECVKNEIKDKFPNVKISLKFTKPSFNSYVFKNYGNLIINRDITYFISIDNTNSDIVYQSVLENITQIHTKCESKFNSEDRTDIHISGSVNFSKSQSFRNKQLKSKLYNDFVKWIGENEPYPGDENSHLFLPRIEQIKGIKPDSESSGERMVRLFLEDNKVKFKQYHKIKGCVSEKNGKCYLLTFDFFIPSKNLVIEYDGGQHFAPVSKFGGQESFERTVMLDEIKNQFCIDNNIKMLRIPYTKKTAEVHQMLNKELGL